MDNPIYRERAVLYEIPKNGDKKIALGVALTPSLAIFNLLFPYSFSCVPTLIIKPGYGDSFGKGFYLENYNWVKKVEVQQVLIQNMTESGIVFHVKTPVADLDPGKSVWLFSKSKDYYFEFTT